MSNYDKETAEQMVLNLARKADLTEAYDVILDNPELCAELAQDDFAASEMLKRIIERNSNRGA